MAEREIVRTAPLARSIWSNLPCKSLTRLPKGAPSCVSVVLEEISAKTNERVTEFSRRGGYLCSLQLSSYDKACVCLCVWGGVYMWGVFKRRSWMRQCCWCLSPVTLLSVVSLYLQFLQFLAVTLKHISMLNRIYSTQHTSGVQNKVTPFPACS